MPYTHDFAINNERLRVSAGKSFRPWKIDKINFANNDAFRNWDRERQRGTVLSYSTRAPQYFGFQHREHEKPPRDALYMGVELEAVYRGNIGDVTKHVYRDLPWAILKQDGSVSNGGEICTAPATFDFHRHNWHAFFNSIGPGHTPASAGLKGWTQNNCGMHVHISKAALTPLILGRIMVFINDPNNTAFVTHLAGRDFNSYCAQYKTKLTEGLYKPDMPRGSVFAPEGAPTVELRIFRSNVKEVGFMKNLEFVYMLVQFCRKSSSTTWASFLNFVRDSKEPWNHPNLSRFLNLPAWEVRTIGDAA